jgi:DNA-binding response OmpR family regulator
MVVEDDEDLRAFYRLALVAAGYAVVTVSDGIDALRIIETNTLPDLVILDMLLPHVGGRDVQRELRAHPETHHIPILIVTGTDIAGMDESEVDCVLRKPITTEALLDAVQRCLRTVRPQIS